MNLPLKFFKEIGSRDFSLPERMSFLAIFYFDVIYRF